MKKPAISVGNRINMFKPRVNSTKAIQSRVHTNGIQTLCAMGKLLGISALTWFAGQGIEGVLVFFLQLAVRPALSWSRSSPACSPPFGPSESLPPFCTSCPEAIPGAKWFAPFLFGFLFINFWLIRTLASLKSTFASSYRSNFLSIVNKGHNHYPYIIWDRTSLYDSGWDWKKSDSVMARLSQFSSSIQSTNFIFLSPKIEEFYINWDQGVLFFNWSIVNL